MAELSKAKLFGIPVIPAVIFAALFAMVMGWWSPLSPATMPGAEEGIYTRSVNIKINEGDYFTGADVSPTNAAYLLFHADPRTGVTGSEAITATGTTTSVSTQYIYLRIYGGDDYYMITDQFGCTGAKIVDRFWYDFDGDGDDDFFVKLDMSDAVRVDSDNVHYVTVLLKLLDEDTSNWSDDNPSDISSIGTSESVQTITWKISGITAEDGAVISRLYFATNSTRGGDDVRFESLSLSGGWRILGQTAWSAPVREDNGNYEAWYLTGEPDYLEPHNGMVVLRGTNDADSLYVTVQVRCTLESGDNITVDLYMDVLSPDGAVTTVNDQVMLSA